MQPAKPSFWRGLLQRFRALLGLDLPRTLQFVDQPIVIEYEIGLAGAAQFGQPQPIAPVAPAIHSNLLLAPRLASVARLNIPSSRKVKRHCALSANRPVKSTGEPVKTRKPEAWVLARKALPAAPTAKVVHLVTPRRQRGAGRASQSLAA